MSTTLEALDTARTWEDIEKLLWQPDFAELRARKLNELAPKARANSGWPRAMALFQWGNPSAQVGNLFDKSDVKTRLFRTLTASEKASILQTVRAEMVKAVPEPVVPAPDPGDHPRLGASVAHWKLWAELHSAQSFLHFHLRAALATIATVRHVAVYSNVTVLDAVGPGSHPLGFDASQRKLIRDASYAWLIEQVQWRRDAAAEEPELLAVAAPVAAPKPVVDVVRLCKAWLHARMGAHLMPMEALGQLTLVTITEPPALQIRAERAPVCMAGASVKVTIGVKATNEGTRLHVEGGCWSGGDRCALCVAVVHAVCLRVASSSVDSEPWRWATVLGAPAWQRVLANWQPAPTTDVAPLELGWRVRGGNGGLAVEAVTFKTLKNGRVKAVKLSGPAAAAAARTSELAQDKLIWATVHALNAVYHAKPAAAYAVLQALRHHPRLVGATDQPLHMAFVTAQLHIEQRTETYLATGLAGAKHYLLADLVNLLAGEDYFIDPSDDEATLCVVEVPPKLSEMARAMVPCAGVFPLEAGAQVAGRLLEAPGVKLALPEAMRGREVAADLRVVVQVAPEDDGTVALALGFRPLPGAPLVLPGEGRDDCLGKLHGEAVWARRDLHAEVVAAQEIADFLGVVVGDNPAEQFALLRADAALDVLERLPQLPETAVLEWRDPAKKRYVVQAQRNQLKVELKDKRDWLAVTGKLQLDDSEIPLQEVFDALRAGRKFVLVHGDTVVRLTEQLRKSLQHILEVARSTKHGTEVSFVHAHHFTEEFDEYTAPARWQATVSAIRTAQAETPQVPPELTATLRPYQIAGVHWLLRLAAWAPGAVLADDMGLGKTVQALAVMLARRTQGPTLVVAPLSLLHNWQREGAKFAPTLRFVALAEADAAQVAALGPSDVLLSSWDRMVRRIDNLKARPWPTLVLDEAQAVKNATTRRADAACQLNAGFRMALTGTPVENRTAELWSVVRTAVPGLFGSWEAFREQYAGPIERSGDATARQALARVLRPFILRRLKRDVAPELPARTDIDIDIELSKEEFALYEAHRRAALLLIEQSAHLPPEQRRFQVLAALTKLRQLACHPRLVEADSEIGSSKLELLVDRLVELKVEGHRALVFSQFTRHLALVRTALEKEALVVRYLDGQMTEVARRAEVDAFQAGQGDVFLLSLKAGGVGLNLTAATYVFHLDPWWNPAVEDQATDRAHRIGQNRAVTVYRLIARGTVEEAILQLHADKRRLVEDLLEGTGASAALSTDELLELLKSGRIVAADGETVHSPVPPRAKIRLKPSALPNPA